MIRIQRMPDGSRSWIARHYENPNAGPLEDYGVVFLLNAENNETDEVWIHAMMGEASRKMLREMTLELHKLGFKYIRALRQEHRILPRSRPHPDGRGLVMTIADFLGPLGNEVSGFAAL